MRTISLSLRQAMNAQQTGVVPIVLVTVTHPDLTEPLRVSSDPTVRLSEAPLRYGTISRGNTYSFMPFGMSLPDDVAERAPIAELVVENVSRVLRDMLELAEGALVTIEIVTADAPDEVEVDFPMFDLKRTTANANTATLGLAIDALTTEPYPGTSFDPSAFPGLF